MWTIDKISLTVHFSFSLLSEVRLFEDHYKKKKEVRLFEVHYFGIACIFSDIHLISGLDFIHGHCVLLCCYMFNILLSLT